MTSEQAPELKPFLYAVVLVAAAHVLVVSVGRSLLASNVIQLASSLLPVLISVTIACHKRDAYVRNVWITLALAFLIWSVAQSYFVAVLFHTHAAPVFPSPADFLWLSFAFPILLLTVVRRSWKRTEWVTWLDCAQACLCFVLLYALTFERPAAITVSEAYDVQSAVLLLACALRYSSTRSEAERTFFRNLGIYLLIYAGCSSVSNRLHASGLAGGRWIDLFWSAPHLIFCLVVICSKLDFAPVNRRINKAEAKAPKYLRGVSAAGLSVMSACGALVLHSRHDFAGIGMFLVAFAIFTMRTIARESQLTEAQSRLEQAVVHDSLTGLSNRDSLLSELRMTLLERDPEVCKVALLYIDFDRFKAVNDSLGHQFGDQVLVKLAGMLEAQLGKNDCVARLGGDEFAVLLEYTSPSETRAFARKIVTLFQQPISLYGRLLYLTASVGVSLCTPDITAEEMLRGADCAMYTAKKKGKNQEQNFDRRMMERLNTSLELETDLRIALEEKALEVHYQPIYSTETNEIAGFEALSRWRHPQRGMIPPVDFIPLAEETGLIMELGAQVLLAACRQVKEWNTTFGSRFFVSVNISAPQFVDPQLADQILEVLSDVGLSPELLKLEVTESVLLSGVDTVEAVLTKLRRRGVKIALDDFGTGYSSLSYLLGLPFDVVKIDRSFVRDFTEDVKREQILRTIIRLVTTLEKQVVAEGVETALEKFGLQEMGCDFLQGYYMAKPLPPDQIPALVKAAQWTGQTQSAPLQLAASR